jgi:hypothetical protein
MTTCRAVPKHMARIEFYRAKDMAPKRLTDANFAGTGHRLELTGWSRRRSGRCTDRPKRAGGGVVEAVGERPALVAGTHTRPSCSCCPGRTRS